MEIELVRITFAMHLRHDVLVIVVPVDQSRHVSPEAVNTNVFSFASIIVPGRLILLQSTN
jgi:hypothetical protein